MRIFPRLARVALFCIDFSFADWVIRFLQLQSRSDNCNLYIFSFEERLQI